MNSLSDTDTVAAVLRGEATRHVRVRVFDWDAAALLLRARGVQYASAGLREDWCWTGGAIVIDGAPVLDSSAYLSSTWATPVLVIEDEVGKELEVVECWRLARDEETTGSEATPWPATAVAVLSGKETL